MFARIVARSLGMTPVLRKPCLLSICYLNLLAHLIVVIPAHFRSDANSFLSAGSYAYFFVAVATPQPLY
jgi:hypothetical protein